MAHNEQVFTPRHIVEEILDSVGYGNGIGIRKKHIIDNSCGNGNFLVEIARKYAEACQNDGVSEEETVSEMETYIHGIELDPRLCEEAVGRCRDICKEFGITRNINFDIRNGDTLYMDAYDGKMDYVVGNPPYCKVHDLKEKYGKVKEFKFAQDGMADLYLVFFEKGIRMLKPDGKLGYITPSSWMTSLAGKNFRDWLMETGKLQTIDDYQGNKVFDNATTFTNITVIANGRCEDRFYFRRNGGKVLEGSLKESFINGKFFLGTSEELNGMRAINECPTYHKIKAKNGFATLNDKLFIGGKDGAYAADYPNGNIIKVYKVSKGEEGIAAYPYDKDGKPLEYASLGTAARGFLMKNLENGCKADTSTDGWHLYGRYQGIKDMPKYRIGINNIVKGTDSINFKLLEPYEGIYSGLYLVCEEDGSYLKGNFNKIREAVVCEDFIKYVMLLGKYKNGGYYTFSSKELEAYVNKKLFSEEEAHDDSVFASEYVMGRYFGCNGNKNKPTHIGRGVLERLLEKHGKNGFSCITACNSRQTDEAKWRETIGLRKKIEKKGYRYFPFYNSFDCNDVCFIVFNCDKTAIMEELRLSNECFCVLGFVEEMFCNPDPCTPAERKIREGHGEILLRD